MWSLVCFLRLTHHAFFPALLESLTLLKTSALYSTPCLHTPLARAFLKGRTMCFYLYLRYPACEPSYSQHQQFYFESMSDYVGVCRRYSPILAIFRSVCPAGKCVGCCCSLDPRAVQRYGPSSQECIYFLLFPRIHLFLTVSVILPHFLGTLYTLEPSTRRSLRSACLTDTRIMSIGHTTSKEQPKGLNLIIKKKHNRTNPFLWVVPCQVRLSESLWPPASHDK